MSHNTTLSLIFAQLDPVSLARSSQVCLQWRDVINNELVWQSCFRRHFADSDIWVLLEGNETVITSGEYFRRIRPSQTQLIQVLESVLLNLKDGVDDNDESQKDKNSIQALLEELKKLPDTPLSIQYARNPPYWKWFTVEQYQLKTHAPLPTTWKDGPLTITDPEETDASLLKPIRWATQRWTPKYQLHQFKEDDLESKQRRKTAKINTLKIMNEIREYAKKELHVLLPNSIFTFWSFFIGLSEAERKLFDYLEFSLSPIFDVFGDGGLGISTYMLTKRNVSYAMGAREYNDDPPEVLPILRGRQDLHYSFWYDDPKLLPSHIVQRYVEDGLDSSPNHCFTPLEVVRRELEYKFQDCPSEAELKSSELDPNESKKDSYTPSLDGMNEDFIATVNQARMSKEYSCTAESLAGMRNAIMQYETRDRRSAGDGYIRRYHLRTLLGRLTTVDGGGVPIPDNIKQWAGAWDSRMEEDYDPSIAWRYGADPYCPDISVYLPSFVTDGRGEELIELLEEKCANNEKGSAEHMLAVGRDYYCFVGNGSTDHVPKGKMLMDKAYKLLNREEFCEVLNINCQLREQKSKHDHLPTKSCIWNKIDIQLAELIKSTM